MEAPKSTDGSRNTVGRGRPEAGHPWERGSPGAELIARELAYEAMKRLIRCGGDEARLSELGRAALSWAVADSDERDSYLDSREATEAGSRPPRFVDNTDGRVWVTRPILRIRGWTDTAIRDFLPDPEGRKPNPRFQDRGNPMPVWLPETVAEAESTPEWHEWLRKSLRRRKKTMQEIKEEAKGDFRRRVDAVQEVIDSYLRAQITRKSRGPRAVIAAE